MRYCGTANLPLVLLPASREVRHKRVYKREWLIYHMYNCCFLYRQSRAERNSRLTYYIIPSITEI